LYLPVNKRISDAFWKDLEETLMEIALTPSYFISDSESSNSAVTDDEKGNNGSKKPFQKKKQKKGLFFGSSSSVSSSSANKEGTKEEPTGGGRGRTTSRLRRQRRKRIVQVIVHSSRLNKRIFEHARPFSFNCSLLNMFFSLVLEKVEFTGHSMGGACAVLLGARTQRHFLRLNQRLKQQQKNEVRK
jgi:hypothetical protein